MVSKEALEQFSPFTVARKSLAVAETVNRDYDKIGCSPKETIWRLNKARLYHYLPSQEQRQPVPVLLTFALMNSPAVFDFQPGKSFVEYLVNKGYDTYLLDWGVPGTEDRNTGFGDYIHEYLPRAIRSMQRLSGSAVFDQVGWCQGGVIASGYAATHPDEGLRRQVLLTTPLDFGDVSCGGFMPMVHNMQLDEAKIDAILAAHNGLMPGEMIDAGAKLLRPYESIVGNYVNLWDKIDDPKAVESWQAMNAWTKQLKPMAGRAYKELIVDLYWNNRLVNGSWAPGGKPIDLSNVKADVLAVVASADHIVPPQQTVNGLSRIGSNPRLVEIPGGHISSIIGKTAAKVAWPQIEAFLAA